MEHAANEVSSKHKRRDRELKFVVRWRKLPGALFAVFLFFIPCIAILCFAFSVSDYVPSARLNPLAAWAAAIAAILYVSVFANLLTPGIRSPRQTKRFVESLLLLLFSPIFGAWIWLSFVSGPVSYVLHLAEPPSTGSMVEEVIYADIGSRWCRNQVQLRSELSLQPRRVCGVSRKAVEDLQQGGRIELEGLRSSYGIQVRRYSYVQSAS